MNKRGVSQIITTIILVLISLVAALTVWNLVRGFTNQADDDDSLSSFLVRTEIDKSAVYVSTGSFGATPATPYMRVSVRRKDTSDVVIDKMRFVVTGDSGDARSYVISVGPTAMGTLTYYLNIMGLDSDGQGIEIQASPVIGTRVGATSDFTTSTGVVRDPVGGWPAVEYAVACGETSEYCDGTKEMKESSVCAGKSTIEETGNSCSCDLSTAEANWVAGASPGCSGGIEIIAYTDDNDYCRTPISVPRYCSMENYISWWKFDDNTNDEKGANNGTLVGGSIYEARISGQALKLDGVGDYVSLGNKIDFKIADKTISFWAKPSSAITGQSSVFSSSGLNYYVGFNSPNKMFVSFIDSIGHKTSQLSNENTVVVNEWHLYTYVFDISSNTITGYIDQKKQVIWPVTGGYSISYGANFIIGAFNTGSLFFKGSIDDVMIYNRALTEAEITGIYCSQGGSGAVCS